MHVRCDNKCVRESKALCATFCPHLTMCSSSVLPRSFFFLITMKQFSLELLMEFEHEMNMSNKVPFIRCVQAMNSRMMRIKTVITRNNKTNIKSNIKVSDSFE